MPSRRRAAVASAVSLGLAGALAWATVQEPATVPVTTLADGRDYGIGQLLRDADAVDFAGKTHALRDLRGETATVLAMFDLSCPLAKKWRPELARIEDDFADRGVRFVFIDSTGLDTAEDVAAEAKRLGLDGPILDDAGRTLAKTIGAETSTDMVVLDAAGTRVYRGAIDDQYGLQHTRAEATETYLRDALAAVVDGRPVETPATRAPGCVLDLADVEVAEVAPTYHNRISRIIAQNCQSCHRDGGVAPFALEDYASVKKRAGMIRYVVDNNIMPPWPAGENADHAGFANDRRLSDADIAAILAWADAGGPQGDPADAPLPPSFPDAAGWTIGEPDLVVALPEPQQVKADGFMPYRYLRVPAGLTQDKWVRAMQVRPTAPEVVHHVLVFAVPPEDLDGSPEARYRLRRRFATEAGYFTAYVPGNDRVELPDGLARKIKAGSEIVFQIHYTPNGEATVDQTELGLVFADEPPERESRVYGITDHRLNIPPGAAAHEESASLDISRDVTLLSLMPHMHLRGKSFTYTLTTPDGQTRTLLDVPAWDFNWQFAYRLAKPLAVPKGSRIDVVAQFDNSPDNPFNPDATQRVRLGEQTTDEMLIGYIEYYRNDEPVEVESQ